MRLEECEFEEKAKTYKPIDELPIDYGRYVRKKDIGRIQSTIYGVIYITDKREDEIAKERFSKHFHNSINTLKHIVASYEEVLQAVNDFKVGEA